ncbi:hypothetical protein [Paenibacillus sp. ACRRY]|uniref:hypothetical protein n=1 Tax=Paenibacillus sp. ACRRY TaxID=2918208 RepID=UPI001EF66C6A|nr:hypothetical protein [Paenibacillus sp. ACRRY]MCG7381937.1 hypothetical protein [Paenibacillus sp. ACRRY]
MVANIFLFSYEPSKPGWTERCIESHLESLYDVKHLHNKIYLIKTDDDIDLLEKYLTECFNPKDRYYLLEVKDEPFRFRRPRSKYIKRWIEDV